MVRLTGGSSLRYCEEVQQFREQPVGDRGTPHTVFCGCGVDEYNYGIHAYTLLHAIMGAGPISARHVHQGVQRRIEIHWPGHRTGILMIGAAEQWLPFHATIVTEKSVSAFNVDASRLYRSMLEVVLPYLEGRLEQPPVSPRELIEPELMALAAKLSWENGDRPVRLDELNSGTVSYDGAAFAVEYKASKYGG
jgi:hypothetical protein